MTRQEAIDKLLPVYEMNNKGLYTLESHLSAGAFVDSMIVLGMLKIDEPKTIEQKAQEALETRVTPLMAKTCLETLAAWNFGLMKK